MNYFVVFLLAFSLARGEECTKDCSETHPSTHVVPVVSKPQPIKPKPDTCNPDDEPCELAIVNHLATPVIKKALEETFAQCHGLHIGLIPGIFSTLVFHADKHNITGLQDCKLTKINISPDVSAAQFSLECPAYTSAGQMNHICGYLINIPIMGNGKFVINFGKHTVTVYSKLECLRCDNKTYIQFGDFTTDVKALSPIKYDFKNLYNGNAYLSKIVSNFASCHWSELSLFSNGPLWDNVLIKIFEECNEKLRKAAAANLFACC